MLEVPVFHGDPLVEEPLMEKCRPLKDPLMLILGGHSQKDLQIRIAAEIGMVTVGTFNDSQLFRDSSDRLGKGLGLTL